MKVLLCAPTKPVGGITKWTGYITDYFSTHPVRNMSVEIFQMNKSSYLGENAPIFKRLKSGISAYSKVIRNFNKYINGNHPDIVHICSSASFGLIRDLLMLRKCRRKGIRTCIHFHFGRIPEIIESNNWEFKLLKQVLHLASHIIVMNEESYNALIKIGITNVSNIPNPLSPDVISLVDTIKTVRDKNKFVFVGHVLYTKGIKELIEAVSEIPNITLTIVGEDPMDIESDLRIKYPSAFIDDKVTFLGSQSHENVIREMKTGIFVFPSYSEGFPNVILESMACGIPIIASSVGSIPEMLNINGDPCGLCIPPRNSGVLKDAIIYALENPTEINQMGINAQRRVMAQYNITNIGNILSRCWKDTINIE